MDFIVKNSAEEIGIEIANIIARKIEINNHCVLGLATGSSPLAIYKELINLYQKNGLSFSNVTTFNLDEYYGAIEDSKTYRYFMFDNLFKHIDIDLKKTHFPSAESPEKYDELIRVSGGIDIQLLGIGQNGHIAFNEPHTSFNSKTHIVTLDEKTRNDNARFFESLHQVPTKAVTMGLKTIMEAREIIIVIQGDNKVETLRLLLSLEPNESFPASILKQHKNVKVYTTFALFNKTFGR